MWDICPTNRWEIGDWPQNKWVFERLKHLLHSICPRKTATSIYIDLCSNYYCLHTDSRKPRDYTYQKVNKLSRMEQIIVFVILGFLPMPIDELLLFKLMPC